MLRKIRRFYWKQRDKGLGRQTVMAAVGAALFLMIILGAVTKSVIMPKNESRKNVARTETASGTAIGAEVASGGGVAIEGAEASVDPDDETTDYTADDSNNDVSVDMTDLEPFLGFMSETAYEELKTQLVQICQERNCSSVRKLTYQQTQAFDVTSFILLPDGSVYQCNYNLKSCQVSVSKTDYTEVQINQIGQIVQTKKAKEDIFQRLDKMPRQKEAKKIKIAFRQIVQTEEGSDRMNDAKTEILRVRMTPMEKAALSRQANDQHKTMSEYIRSIAKCPPEVTRDEFEGSILQMIYEINKIGVNINQIAKKYNEHNYVEPRADLLEKLDEVYGMMKSTIRLMKGA